MATVRTESIVLRQVEIFESSLVVTLFTRELGKVSALAKGARRLRSPMQGALDLVGVSDIVLLHKASDALDLVTEATPIERFASLRRDLTALYAGYYIIELLVELTDLHDPHPRLFDAAVVTLRHLDDPVLRSRRVFRFELACLRELGLMPSLDDCSSCGMLIENRGDPGTVAFGLATGGVLCPACRPGEPHVATLSWRTLEAIRMLAAPGSAWRDLDPPTFGAIRSTLGAILSHLLGHRPKLLAYLGA